MGAEELALTTDERKLAFLATAAIVGGGMLAFQAATAASGPGGLLGVDMPEKTDESVGTRIAAAAATAAGIFLTYEALEEARAEITGIGTAPIVLGTLGVFGVALFLRSRR